MFVWGFSSYSIIFHSYGDVTIPGEGLQISTYARHLCPLSIEGSLVCHTYCDTGHLFIMVISCLLYTSDAADDMQCVDLGGWRIIKKIFFFQAEDGIRDVERSRGLGDVYKRQTLMSIEY